MLSRKFSSVEVLESRTMMSVSAAPLAAGGLGAPIDAPHAVVVHRGEKATRVSHLAPQLQTSAIRQLRPDPYGLRGSVTYDRVQLFVNGVPKAGQTLYFSAYALGASGQPGHAEIYLGSARTDSSGIASFRYVIPNDTHWSNVYIESFYDGNGNTFAAYSQVRVQIGTNTPD